MSIYIKFVRFCAAEISSFAFFFSLFQGFDLLLSNIHDSFWEIGGYSHTCAFELFCPRKNLLPVLIAEESSNDLTWAALRCIKLADSMYPLKFDLWRVFKVKLVHHEVTKHFPGRCFPARPIVLESRKNKDSLFFGMFLGAIVAGEEWLFHQ